MKKKLSIVVLMIFFLLPQSVWALPKDDFIDVSSWNGTIPVESYQKLINTYGVKGSVVKLTEGMSYRNPAARNQIENARAAGLQVSAYHYAQYNSEWQARLEAQFFAQTARDLGFQRDDLLINDLEEHHIPNKTATSLAFFDELRKQGFINIMLYVSGSWLDNQVSVAAFGKENFWVAAYPYEPAGKQWYTEYGAWQWSSDRSFSNVYSGIGRFDISQDYTGRFTKKATATVTQPSHTKPTPKTKSSVYIVVTGDTLSKIGGKVGVSWPTLAQINGLSAPYIIYPGQRLNIVGSTIELPKLINHITHKVKAGETLSGIAAKYGTSYQALAQLNGLSNPNLIYVGQQLMVNGKQAMPSNHYVVVSGDTLSAIAGRLGTTVQRLAQVNGIRNPNLIYPGQNLTY
ncbi:LysM peptidoglycan-binding domain-containing protein [Listeria monocytogenes]|nr:LysM peptidoglycan-binding domain-containing protein [Listeria monocytogenes]